MKPLTGYPGGKSRLAKVILKHAPPHTTYVEPFAGGASVFWAKTPAKINVLNDVDKQLMKFYKNFRCSNLKRCVLSNPATLKNKKKFTTRFRQGSSGTCDYFMARRFSFNNNGKDVNHTSASAGKKVGGSVVNRCDLYEKRLKRARLLSTDFRTVMRRYDSKNTFHYLDPPYKGRAKGLYRNENVTPQEVCDAAKKMKGKVLVSFSDTPEIRKACRGLKMKKIGHTYVSRTRNHGDAHKVNELLIANFKL
jgi:DNA adenine methylase